MPKGRTNLMDSKRCLATERRKVMQRHSRRVEREDLVQCSLDKGHDGPHSARGKVFAA